MESEHTVDDRTRIRNQRQNTQNLARTIVLRFKQFRQEIGLHRPRAVNEKSPGFKRSQGQRHRIR